jgi:hypothetical protein
MIQFFDELIDRSLDGGYADLAQRATFGAQFRKMSFLCLEFSGDSFYAVFPKKNHG